MPNNKRKYYGVGVGHNPGVYESWEDCKRQVTGYPGNQYQAFPTRAEAERYMQDFVTSVQKLDSVQEISNRHFQASPISKLEPNKGQRKESTTKWPKGLPVVSEREITEDYLVNIGGDPGKFREFDSANMLSASRNTCYLSIESSPKVIQEEGEQFVVFESISHFDKPFDSLLNFYEGEKSKIGGRSSAYLDCESNRGGIGRPKECRSSRSRLANTHLNNSDRHDSASTPSGVDNKSDQLSFPQESCTGTQCIAQVRKLEEGEEFLCFENESVLENYLKPFSNAKNWSNALSHGLQPQKSSEGKPEKSSICAGEHLSCESDQLQPDVIYQLEFDGASKGNPGRAGAGALLRNPDGSVAFELTESLGMTTNNVAEYCSLILGLRGALARGVKKIRVQGDSKLVCLQVRGIWKLKNEKLIPLCKIAKQLMEKFEEFSITHVERDLNSAADALANAAVFQLETNFAREILSNADPNLQPSFTE